MLQNEKLDKKRSEDDKKNKIIIEKLKEQLKAPQNELQSIKARESQATNVIQKKMRELRIKLQNYEGIELKLKKVEIEKRKQEESINESENVKVQEYNDKIRLTEDKLNKIKDNIGEAERKVTSFEEQIGLLDNEIQELKKLETKSKANQKTPVNSSTRKSISQYILPDLFISEVSTKFQQLVSKIIEHNKRILIILFPV